MRLGEKGSMSRSFSSASIENLKAQVNIVDVIGDVVTLKRAGSGYKGLCPFHKEKTPSFSVSESRQYFTCFGCGASGDVFEFMKRYYNMDFPDAVEKLAERYNVKMESREYNDGKKKKLYEINRMAAGFFYKAFTEKENPGLPYMLNRELTRATLKKFGIGYADPEWQSLYHYLKSQGVEEKSMLELGLIFEGKGKNKGKFYDKFRNRVIFPYIDTSGKVIGFGARRIDDADNPKYLNSDESSVFQKKNNLYALQFARQEAAKAGNIILVEGYMDVISLFQAGVRNVSASCGTALTENQAKLLKRYTKDVILCYDSDAAGRKAALRGIEILKKEGLKVRVLHVPDGKDPDEFIKKNGKEEFLELAGNALPYADYKLDSLRQNFDLSTDDGKVDYLKAAKTVIAGLDPIEREIYKNKVAEEFRISAEAITPDTPPEVPIREREEAQKEAPQTELTRLEKTLLRLIVKDGAYIWRIRSEAVPLSLPCMHLMDLAEQAYQTEGHYPDSFYDMLDPEDFGQIRSITEEIPLGGDTDVIFRDCIRNCRMAELDKKERDLLNRLSMAESMGRPDLTGKLMNELMALQKEKKRIKGN